MRKAMMYTFCVLLLFGALLMIGGCGEGGDVTCGQARSWQGEEVWCATMSSECCSDSECAFGEICSAGSLPDPGTFSTVCHCEPCNSDVQCGECKECTAEGNCMIITDMSIQCCHGEKCTTECCGSGSSQVCMLDPTGKCCGINGNTQCSSTQQCCEDTCFGGGGTYRCCSQSTGVLCQDDQICCKNGCCGPGQSCCGDVCYDPETQLCCDYKNVCTKGSEQCCQDECYNPATQICCKDGAVHHFCLIGGECCGSKCCDGTLTCTIPATGICGTCTEDLHCGAGRGCCAEKGFTGQCYGQVTEKCCTDTDTPYVCKEYESCCGGKCYNSLTEMCCGNTVCSDEKICCGDLCMLNTPGVSCCSNPSSTSFDICDPGVQCCAGAGKCYDSTQKCCQNTLCAADEVCCGSVCCSPGQVCADPETGECRENCANCDENQDCCGTDCYDVNTEQCCQGETETRCPIYQQCCGGTCCGPGYGCCDGICYNTATQTCCNDVTICSANTQACCFGECYNPAAQVCCKYEPDGYYFCDADQQCCGVGVCCGRDHTCTSTGTCDNKCTTDSGCQGGRRCCGGRCYDPTTEVCCANQFSSAICDADTQGCCGAGCYELNTELCCGGNLVCNQGQACCGTECYTPGAGQTCCIESRAGQIKELCYADESCCASKGKCYYSSSEKCCPNRICPDGTACCGENCCPAGQTCIDEELGLCG